MFDQVNGRAVPEYSFVIPTYRRPDMLTLCLERIAALDYARDRIEVLVIDNGGPAENTAAAAEPFRGRLPLRYLVNAVNRGLGYSLQRGLRLARGRRVVSMNDDALLPPDFLTVCDASFADPAVGCVGCRVIERGFAKSSPGIGRIADSGEVLSNFDEDCGRAIEVDHVYGFCYVFTREAIQRAGGYDDILLAKPYSSANRIETDHCLSIKRSGLKVVFNPRLVVEHLAKPRADYHERSTAWHLNRTRNTLYLFLKHYGLLGKRCLALRFTLLQDVGLVSALRRPNRANLAYLLTGLRARLSAYGHYLLYLAGE